MYLRIKLCYPHTTWSNDPPVIVMTGQVDIVPSVNEGVHFEYNGTTRKFDVYSAHTLYKATGAERVVRLLPPDHNPVGDYEQALLNWKRDLAFFRKSRQWYFEEVEPRAME